MKTKTALVTGAAKRIGACIARSLHASGYDLILHYRRSEDQASALMNELNQIRNNSAWILQADWLDDDAIDAVLEQVSKRHSGLDVLVNNASSFYATPLAEVNVRDWDRLMGTNLKVPFFLSVAFYNMLRQRNGCIVNIGDIHAWQPLQDYSIYCITKSGLVAVTRSLALEMGPEVRVNGVAPGAILWPEDDLSQIKKQEILNKIPLARIGSPRDIANAVLYLVQNGHYVTGQIISIDGGRSLFK